MPGQDPSGCFSIDCLAKQKSGKSRARVESQARRASVRPQRKICLTAGTSGEAVSFVVVVADRHFLCSRPQTPSSFIQMVDIRRKAADLLSRLAGFGEILRRNGVSGKIVSVEHAKLDVPGVTHRNIATDVWGTFCDIAHVCFSVWQRSCVSFGCSCLR